MCKNNSVVVIVFRPGTCPISKLDLDRIISKLDLDRISTWCTHTGYVLLEHLFVSLSVCVCVHLFSECPFFMPVQTSQVFSSLHLVQERWLWWINQRIIFALRAKVITQKLKKAAFLAHELYLNRAFYFDDHVILVFSCIIRLLPTISTLLYWTYLLVLNSQSQRASLAK